MTTGKAARIAIAMLAGLAFAACAREAPPAPPEPAEAAVRAVAQGEVIGFAAGTRAHVWRGLPFAASTAGENRWRAPRPAPAWEGARVAVEHGPRCPQITNAFHRGEGYEPGLVIGSEDCLYADVYAPAMSAGEAAAARLPVMVWIHGGGNVWGRAASYDGANLAANENVIVVAVQYRMGPLGWFAHDAIRESAETPADAGANFGTLDLIAALDWVRENAAAFGGDPDNVTIFGESAGGHNVASLLASPLAAGLFHRAIIQSGSFDSVPLHAAEHGGQWPNHARAVAERLGAASAADLRAASVEDVYGALALSESGYLDLPRIIEDGVVLPAGPLRAAFASPGGFNAVPVMTGVNRDEMKLFQMLDPEQTKRVLWLFPVARDQNRYDAASDTMSRLWRLRSVDEPAAMMAAGGHEAVYAYRFDWDEGGRFLFTDLSKLLGAAHAIEIPFVFNRFQLLGDLDRVMFQRKTEESRRALADAMGGYWAAFARQGAPGDGGRGLPRWPRWGEGALMRLDSAESGGPEVIEGAESFDAVLADLAADPRIDDAARCEIAAALLWWTPERRADVAEATGCALGGA